MPHRRRGFPDGVRCGEHQHGPILIIEGGVVIFVGRRAPKLRSDLATQPLAMNNHYRGIEPSNFAADRRSALFDVLSTNHDRQSRPFVSTMESSQNLYAVQWHPEKNAFENACLSQDGTPFEGINHGPEAVAATFALAQSFVGRARASRHQFMERDAWRFENCVALRTHR